MKPLMLTMQAFGPYLKETVVDFSALQNSSLFLITGSTGGGKTTILDAMCFALYCRATGGKRKWNSMRCNSAKDDIPTVVDFTFALGSDTYRFRRVQYVHIVRGSNRREIREEHECWQKKENDDFHLMESGAESRVRICAEQLLGLTCDQFSQVMVLPQGNFLRLLRAPSTEKSKMLQTLFSVDIWSQIIDAFRAESRNLEKELNNLSASYNSILQQQDCSTSEEIKNKLNTLKTQQKQLQIQTQELSTKLEYSAQILEKRRLLSSAEKNLKSEQEHLQKIKSEVTQSLLQAKQATEKAKKIPLLRQRAAELDRHQSQLQIALENLQKVQEFSKKLKQLEIIGKKTVSEHQSAQQTIKSVEQEISSLKKELSDLQEQTSLLPKIIENKNTLTSINEQYNSLLKLQNRLKEENKKVSIALKKKQQAELDYQLQTEALAEQETLLNENHAASLALTLQESQPCPVCGSTLHPNPAKPFTKSFNKDKMSLIKKKLPILLKEQQAKQTDYATVCARTEQIKSDIEQQQEICKNSGETLESVSQQLQKIEIQYQQLNSAADALEMKQKDLTKKEFLLKTLRQKEQELQKNEMQTREEYSSIRTSYREYLELFKKNSDGNTSQKEITSQLEAEKKQAEQENQQAEKLEQEKNKANQILSAKQATEKASYEQTIKYQIEMEHILSFWQGKEPEPLEDLQAKYNSLKQQYDTNIQTDGMLNQKEQSLQKAFSNLIELETILNKKQTRYSKIERLSSGLSGHNANHVPIDQFVLRIMLTEILASANLTLSQFSRGRYMLRCSNEYTGGNAMSGLDLVVLDGANSSERSIETLSGGEQFLASLALALGLSDIVQQRSGCVRLDSLFIDEGFGSLDQETLDTAMKALAQIQRSGRIIGIISHVNELKERIPAHIEVQPQKDGTSSLFISV